MSARPITCDCGHDAMLYVRRHDGTACYPCSSAQDRARIALAGAGSKLAFHVTPDGGQLVNRPGDEMLRVIRWGAWHGVSWRKQTVEAVDPYGRLWRGVGDIGGIARIRCVADRPMVVTAP